MTPQVGEVTEERGSADYRVTYLLDGRPIGNPIHREFQLKDGLIIRQIDTCDFQNWAGEIINSTICFELYSASKGLLGLAVVWHGLLQEQSEADCRAAIDRLHCKKRLG